jgi:hypothetical protein
MNSAQAFFTCFSSKIITVAKAMLIVFDFNQSKNNSIYLYGIINIIWYYRNMSGKALFSLYHSILLANILNLELYLEV